MDFINIALSSDLTIRKNIPPVRVATKLATFPLDEFCMFFLTSATARRL